MDTWYKIRTEKIKEDLSKVKISEKICYGNYLIAEICWLACTNKLKQKNIDNFFKTASIVLQATLEQKGFNSSGLSDIYIYIDTIFRDIVNSETSLQELGLMLGNLTELDNAHYTFTELIAFVRAMATKI